MATKLPGEPASARSVLDAAWEQILISVRLDRAIGALEEVADFLEDLRLHSDEIEATRQAPGDVTEEIDGLLSDIRPVLEWKRSYVLTKGPPANYLRLLEQRLGQFPQKLRRTKHK